MISLPASDPGSTAVWGSKRINPRPRSCLCLTWSGYPSNNNNNNNNNRTNKKITYNLMLFHCSTSILLPLMCNSTISNMVTKTEIKNPLVRANKVDSLKFFCNFLCLLSQPSVVGLVLVLSFISEPDKQMLFDFLKFGFWARAANPLTFLFFTYGDIAVFLFCPILYLLSLKTCLLF